MNHETFFTFTVTTVLFVCRMLIGHTVHASPTYLFTDAFKYRMSSLLCGTDFVFIYLPWSNTLLYLLEQSLFIF